jgi:acyl carrier protein
MRAQHDKSSADCGGQQASPADGMRTAVASILGVADPATLDMTATLNDIGLDSLVGTEIMHMLANNYQLILSAKDIRKLSITKLQEMVKTDSKRALAPANKTTLQINANPVSKAQTSSKSPLGDSGFHELNSYEPKNKQQVKSS